jgi:hypothetical protein
MANRTLSPVLGITWQNRKLELVRMVITKLAQQQGLVKIGCSCVING